MAEPTKWSTGPNLVMLLAKLQELSLRMARLDLHEKAQRLQALLQAQRAK